MRRMSSRAGEHFSYMMFVVHIMLSAGAHFLRSDDHRLMFACGAALWLISGLVWRKAVQDEQN